MLASEDRVKKSIESEVGMRKLLDDYSTKYAALTKSLSQSNSSFDKVKEQMSKVRKGIFEKRTSAGMYDESNAKY